MDYDYYQYQNKQVSNEKPPPPPNISNNFDFSSNTFNLDEFNLTSHIDISNKKNSLMPSNQNWNAENPLNESYAPDDYHNSSANYRQSDYLYAPQTTAYSHKTNFNETNRSATNILQRSNYSRNNENISNYDYSRTENFATYIRPALKLPEENEYTSLNVVDGFQKKWNAFKSSDSTQNKVENNFEPKQQEQIPPKVMSWPRTNTAASSASKVQSWPHHSQSQPRVQSWPRPTNALLNTPTRNSFVQPKNTELFVSDNVILSNFKNNSKVAPWRGSIGMSVIRPQPVRNDLPSISHVIDKFSNDKVTENKTVPFVQFSSSAVGPFPIRGINSNNDLLKNVVPNNFQTNNFKNLSTDNFQNQSKSNIIQNKSSLDERLQNTSSDSRVFESVESHKEWSNCKSCDMTFQTEKAYNVHIRTISHITKAHKVKGVKDGTFPGIKPAIPTTTVIDDDGDWRCEECKIDFPNQQAFKKHNYYLHTEAAIEEVKDEEMDRENYGECQDLEKVDREHEEEEDVTQCKICNVHFVREQAYHTHIRSMTHFHRSKELEEAKKKKVPTATLR